MFNLSSLTPIHKRVYNLNLILNIVQIHPKMKVLSNPCVHPDRLLQKFINKC